MRVHAPACPHPKCGARMVRLYARIGQVFRPVGWWCPECGISKIETSLTTPPRKPV